MKICIDPGHGGFDPGAIGPSGLCESDVVLSIGLKLREKLKLQGINVVMTRDTDTALGKNINEDLNNRVAISNKNNADYFVSIHCNSAVNKKASGTETYCYKFGGQGERLAKAIQEKLFHVVGLPNRGVKEGNFAVLRNTYMPAVLIETAFISNPAEENLLADERWQGVFAEAIAVGICNHLGIKYREEEGVKVIDNVQDALNVLVEKGVINSPDYWVKAVDVVKYLDVLIINMANKLQ